MVSALLPFPQKVKLNVSDGLCASMLGVVKSIARSFVVTSRWAHQVSGI